jgi:hypothetical protein
MPNDTGRSAADPGQVYSALPTANACVHLILSSAIDQLIAPRLDLREHGNANTARSAAMPYSITTMDLTYHATCGKRLFDRVDFMMEGTKNHVSSMTPGEHPTESHLRLPPPPYSGRQRRIVWPREPHGARRGKATQILFPSCGFRDIKQLEFSGTLSVTRLVSRRLPHVTLKCIMLLISTNLTN